MIADEQRAEDRTRMMFHNAQIAGAMFDVPGTDGGMQIDASAISQPDVPGVRHATPELEADPLYQAHKRAMIRNAAARRN